LSEGFNLILQEIVHIIDLDVNINFGDELAPFYLT